MARRAAGALLALLLLAGCSTGAPSGSAGSAGPLTVVAAASLTEPFTRIAEDFEADRPGTAVELSFAGSADIVAQLGQGAPADVVATADEPTMDRLVAEELLAADPEIFARNTLTIVTAPGNPHGISGVSDLAREELALVVCAPQVPCGAATRTVLDAAGASVSPVSEETAVTGVLTAVRTGQADAGLVYVTDALSAAGEVEAVAFPESTEAVNRYPIAVTAGSAGSEAARAFVEHVTSPAGRAVLTAAGFGAP
ncbi:molybdate ABC transporter substrate-binding protein [Nocardia zapadnayensis]|nr:molybdate ABC transporter substrate-binding protein [Nocardia zapadnayensis]MCX0276519.1 molybdate ABC transporter substrate-binding protein [Nocardia zapadnayensis]